MWRESGRGRERGSAMSQPTPEQIKNEIKALEEMQPKVKRFSSFGDDNHEAIDAQLDVLKNDLTDDEIGLDAEKLSELKKKGEIFQMPD